MALEAVAVRGLVDPESAPLVPGPAALVRPAVRVAHAAGAVPLAGGVLALVRVAVRVPLDAEARLAAAVPVARVVLDELPAGPGPEAPLAVALAVAPLALVEAAVAPRLLAEALLPVAPPLAHVAPAALEGKGRGLAGDGQVVAEVPAPRVDDDAARAVPLRRPLAHGQRAVGPPGGLAHLGGREHGIRRRLGACLDRVPVRAPLERRGCRAPLPGLVKLAPQALGRGMGAPPGPSGRSRIGG